MKRISQKRLMEFINSIADVKPSPILGTGDDIPCYYSKIDGSYLTHVGLEKDLKYLLKKGITEQVKQGLGFNPKEQKWYGWPHRVIYGFGVGSKCKKGDCGYIPETPQKLFNDVTKIDDDGWQWQKPENVEIIKDGIRVKTPMVKLIGSDGSEGETSKFISDACDDVINMDGAANYLSIPAEPDFWEIECGRGEWTAKTLEDAKLMACDFASGVS